MDVYTVSTLRLQIQDLWEIIDTKILIVTVLLNAKQVNVQIIEKVIQVSEIFIILFLLITTIVRTNKRVVSVNALVYHDMYVIDVVKKDYFILILPIVYVRH